MYICRSLSLSLSYPRRPSVSSPRSKGPKERPGESSGKRRSTKESSTDKNNPRPLLEPQITSL